MHESYQPCDEKPRDSYDYYHKAYPNNDRDHLSKCRCQYGAEIFYPNCSTSDYHPSCCSNYCGWEECQHSCGNHYERTDQSLGAYNTRAYTNDCTVLNSVGNENNVKYLSTRSRWYPTHICKNEGFCTCNSGVTSEVSSTTTAEMSEHPRGGHVGFNTPECSIIDDRSNNNTSTSLGNDSFYSCLACNSCQIETVYENKGHMSSKSTINHSSNQTLDGQGGSCEASVRDRQRQRKKVNSGYYEFVSPTRIQSRNTSHARASNSSKKETSPIRTEILKRSLHYGYFEVKERGYSSNKYDHEKMSLLELDKIPTKMSKQIDTAHFKESTMIDKSLSAHLGHASAVKMSNKSLLANINDNNRKRLTQSDITKIVNKLMQSETLEVQGSSKIRPVQSHSSKSLTNFKTSTPRKQPMAKAKCTIRDTKKKMKTVRSLSEGSIHVHKRSSKHSTRRSQDRTTSYKNYLDAALDKLETQITRKLQKALTSYRATPTNKPLVTLYQSDTSNTTETLLPNTRSVYCKSSIGTNPSPTMVTPEDIIDSEEVEIDSSDFEGRLSLSEICLPARNNCDYNSDVSSYNTQGSNLTRGSAERCERIKCQQSSSHEYRATQEDKIKNACGIALVTQSTLPQHNRSGYNRKPSEHFKKIAKSITSLGRQLKRSDSSNIPSMLNRPPKQCSTPCSVPTDSTSFSARKNDTLGAHVQTQCCRPKRSSGPASDTIYSTPSSTRSAYQHMVVNDHSAKPCAPAGSCAEHTFGTAHESHACKEDTFRTTLHLEESHSSSTKCDACKQSLKTSRSRLSLARMQIQRYLAHKQRTSAAQDASQPQRITCICKRFKSHIASKTPSSRQTARACHCKPYSKQSLRSVQKTTSMKYLQRRSSRKLDGAFTISLTSRDPCDRSNRFQHHKSSLCTIEEENEYLSNPSLRALRASNSTAASLTQGYPDCRSLTEPELSASKYQVTDSSCELILGHSDPSNPNTYKAYSDDPCKCQHRLPPQCQPQCCDNFRFKDSVYQDCCMKQTCGDCPKKRYYSQILPPYRENPHRNHRNEKQYDKLYRYMLDVPPYRTNRGHGNNFLNVVSFVVFLIIFYVVFQYIDLGIGAGKFL